MRAVSWRRRRSIGTPSSATLSCSGAAASSTMGNRPGRRTPTMTAVTIKNLISASALGFALLAPPVHAQEVPPDQMVKGVTLEVVELISKDREIQAGNRAKLIQ